MKLKASWVLKDRDPPSALRELNRRLYEAFDYEAGVTEPDSPIDHALTEGRGVCQDFAHIMVAICRRLGVPARYVSGYLYTDQASHDRLDSRRDARLGGGLSSDPRLDRIRSDQ